MSDQFFDCKPTNYHAYDGTQPRVDKELTPTCPVSDSLAYVSHSDTLLLTIHRRPLYGGGIMTYQAVHPHHPPPSGAAGQVSLSLLVFFVAFYFTVEGFVWLTV